jgi:uncharacterized surface protein with fasciclin (FAS1) repeats
MRISETRGIVAVAAGLAVLLTGSLAIAQCDSSTQAGKTKDIVDTAVAVGQFKTLAAALTAADLVDALKGRGPFTVFAPTDEAFAKLPKGTLDSLLKPQNKGKLQAILTYHVVAGKLRANDVTQLPGATTLNGQRLDFATSHGKVLVDNARVAKADIHCRNGVIHVIDSVVLPASDNIVATAKGAETFNTLLTAAKKAGLAETLAHKGPFTVFAPTDEAFAKLPDGTLQSLLKPENRDQLAKILKYHVVSGRVYSTDAISAGKAETLAGQKVHIGSSGDEVRVNQARVVNADIDASNGVIHVIDQVLLPK